jgi:fructoselysine-6-P-deglycase FrlB-like protein
MVTNGETRDVSEELDQSDVDEFLSPILDVVPAQLFVEALARERGVPPGFRYISKVIMKL